MPISVECPACEQIFQVSSKYRNRKGRCPHCDGAFVADESVVVNSTDTLSAPAGNNSPNRISHGDVSTNTNNESTESSTRPSSLPIPGVLRKQQETASRPPMSSHTAPPPTSGSAESAAGPLPTDDETSFTANAQQLKGQAAHGASAHASPSHGSSSPANDETKDGNSLAAPQTDRPWKSSTLVIIGIGLIVVSSSIAFGVAELLRPNSSVAETENQPDEDNSQSEFQPESVSSTKVREASNESNLHEDEKPTFLAMDELFRVWSTVNTYLVKLEISSNTGQRTATGFVVDSRGWVVTSYQAVRGAKSIRVSLANTSMTDGNSTEELVDQSRGVLAVDPEHDLAIIAVNRRLVRSVAELPLDSDEVVVGSQRLAVCRVPQPDRRLWITDVRVSGRKTTGELGDVSKQLIKRYGYQIGGQKFEQWIMLDKTFSEHFAGAPLFNTKNQLVGMTVSWSQDVGQSIAIGVEFIKQLVARCDSTNLRPYNQQFDSTSVKSNPDNLVVSEPPKTTIAEQADLDPESPDYEMFQSLYKSIDACQQFNWVASNETQAKLVCQFSERLLKTNSEIAGYRNDAEQFKKSSERLDTAIQNIGKHMDSIEQQIPEDQIRKSNELILKQIEAPESPFVFFAGVHRPSMLGPIIEKQKTIMFKINGTEELLLTTAGKNHFEFRPGSLWMIVGAVHENRKITVTSANEKKEVATRGRVVFTFEIVD